MLKFALAGGVGRGDGSEIKAVNLINHHHLLLQNYYYYYICLWHWTGEGVKKADLESFWHPKTIFFSWLVHTYTAAGILLLALLLLLLPQVDMKTRRWNYSLGVIVRVRGGRGGGLVRLVVMFCGAYDYEPFVVYGNDVRRRRCRVELIEFDEFNMRTSLLMTPPLFLPLYAGLTDYYNSLRESVRPFINHST